MKHFRANFRSAAIAALTITGLSLAGPATASQADLDLIQSYVGDWRGSGTMNSSADNSETVRCVLNITRSSDEKIGFDGRCALAGATLHMQGTMAYISANNRYEAILSSNTRFGGNAIGRRIGNTVSFNIQTTDADGNAARIRAGFGLSNGKINVDFELTNGDGSKIGGKVPFDRE